VPKKFLAAVKGTRLGGKSGDEALALVGDAGTALGVGLVGILDGGGCAGDESVLTIVDGVSVGVREAQISSTSHAAVDGESGAIVEAGGGTLELVDGAELRDGAAERIDARWKGAGERTSVLPCGEGIDGVITVLKNRAGGIEDGIGEGDGLREVDVERADEMFSVDVEIRDGDRGVAGDFALESEAGLLNARGDEIWSEGRDIVSDTLGESGGRIA